MCWGVLVSHVVESLFRLVENRVTILARPVFWKYKHTKIGVNWTRVSTGHWSGNLNDIQLEISQMLNRQSLIIIRIETT